MKASNQMSFVKSITLGPWNWVFEPYDSFWLPPGVPKFPLWKSIVISPAYLAFSLFFNITGLSRRVCEASARVKAKYYIRRGEHLCFQLPNVKRVRWVETYLECRKSIRLNSQLLEALPSLTELDITIPFNMAGVAEQIGLTVARLRNLRKLTVRLWFRDHFGQQSLGWLKRAIAGNPNLTHLVLYQTRILPGLISLSDLFEDIPSERPLRLQHIRLSSHYYQITPIMLPHIRSLRSLNVHFPFWHGADEIDSVWSTLQREKIYVSEIQTNRVTSRFLDYLRHFDHLVALSICSSGGTGNEFDAQNMAILLGILEQHSLRRLRIEPFNWGRWSQCCNHASINNLKQLQGIVLHSGWLWGWDSIDSFWWASTIDDVVAIAYLVSRIEAPVTLMLEGELVLYNKFLTFCRNSSSALVRDLCQRISYRAHKGASGDWEEFCL
jgi:hypothetical protein